MVFSRIRFYSLHYKRHSWEFYPYVFTLRYFLCFFNKIVAKLHAMLVSTSCFSQNCISIHVILIQITQCYETRHVTILRNRGDEFTVRIREQNKYISSKHNFFPWNAIKIASIWNSFEMDMRHFWSKVCDGNWENYIVSKWDENPQHLIKFNKLMESEKPLQFIRSECSNINNR